MRGEIYWVDLDPTRGSEQHGKRPVVILQRDEIRYTKTVVAVPFSSANVDRKRTLPTCVFVPAGVGGLKNESVALCHQIRVLDHDRLDSYLGVLPDSYLLDIEQALRFLLQIR